MHSAILAILTFWRRAGKENMKCNINNCGGEVVDDEPHYIPLGKDVVLKITDMRCKKCGAAYVGGKYQKLERIQNRELCDKLYEFYEGNLHS